MAPTRCDDDTPKADSSPSVREPSPESADYLTMDSAPFYGMFDRGEDDVDDSWAQHYQTSSPRGSIPEASETFQRVLRQLDGIEELAGRSSSSDNVNAKCEVNSDNSRCDTVTAKSVSGQKGKTVTGKGSQVVRKSASFSCPDCQSSKDSSGDSSSSLAAEARRRKSVPCMPRDKHVQWADEAGVRDLVSVRLIRPRLAKSDKEEAQVSVPRSILRRLTGIH